MLPPPPEFSGQHDIAAFAAVPIEQRLQDRDIIAMIRDAAALAADRPALSYRPSGKADGPVLTLTRNEFVRDAAAFAARLAAEGIDQNDVVASLLPNGPGTLSAAIGTLSAAVLAPINIFLEVAQIGKLLIDSKASAALVPRDPPAVLATMFSTLRQMARDRSLRLIEVDTESKWRSAEDARPLASRNPGDRVALFHTGGTTGLPKFVPLQAEKLAATALISQFAYGYRESDLVLCAMPMFHVGGLFACSLLPLTCGAHVSILGALGYRGDGVIAALPQTISDLRATVVIGPPTVMAQLAERPPDMNHADHLRLFVSGAAALPPTIGRRLSEATGIPVVEPWGLTEATLAVASGPRNGPRKQGSVGLALPYCDVKAVHTDMSGKAIGDCAIDEIGVLAIHGPMVFDGYVDRAPQDQPFFAHHWLDTGDLGRIDADGFIWVTGRAKELIKRGGHGIDPGVIEDVLLGHPDVALAAAVGRPDSYAGEVPIAYVQPKLGVTIDPELLVDFAREHMSERAAIPKEILVVERLPLTAIGKVHKQTLKLDITRRVAEGLVHQITGSDAVANISVEPHALHGLMVHVRVPNHHVDAVTQTLAAFAFRSEVAGLEEEK